eukprot:1011834-Prorocentrum_minimum.AAC.1
MGRSLCAPAHGKLHRESSSSSEWVELVRGSRAGPAGRGSLLRRRARRLRSAAVGCRPGAAKSSSSSERVELVRGSRAGPATDPCGTTRSSPIGAGGDPRRLPSSTAPLAGSSPPSRVGPSMRMDARCSIDSSVPVAISAARPRRLLRRPSGASRTKNRSVPSSPAVPAGAPSLGAGEPLTSTSSATRGVLLPLALGTDRAAAAATGSGSPASSLPGVRTKNLSWSPPKPPGALLFTNVAAGAGAGSALPAFVPAARAGRAASLSPPWILRADAAARRCRLAAGASPRSSAGVPQLLRDADLGRRSSRGAGERAAWGSPPTARWRKLRADAAVWWYQYQRRSDCSRGGGCWRSAAAAASPSPPSSGDGMSTRSESFEQEYSESFEKQGRPSPILFQYASGSISLPPPPSASGFASSSMISSSSSSSFFRRRQQQQASMQQQHLSALSTTSSHIF